MEGEEMEVETRVALLFEKVDRLLSGVERMTEELRHTNQAVADLTFSVRSQDERMGRLQRELYTQDDSSRIRTLELRVKGLYAVCLFIAAGMLGQFLAGLYHWPIAGK
jgi:hypothetical protein